MGERLGLNRERFQQRGRPMHQQAQGFVKLCDCQIAQPPLLWKKPEDRDSHCEGDRCVGGRPAPKDPAAQKAESGAVCPPGLSDLSSHEQVFISPSARRPLPPARPCSASSAQTAPSRFRPEHRPALSGRAQRQREAVAPIPRTFPCPSISFRRCQRGLCRRWR
jgi:hypothetical protein